MWLDKSPKPAKEYRSRVEFRPILMQLWSACSIQMIATLAHGQSCVSDLIHSPQTPEPVKRTSSAHVTGSGEARQLIV